MANGEKLAICAHYITQRPLNPINETKINRRINNSLISNYLFTANSKDEVVELRDKYEPFENCLSQNDIDQRQSRIILANSDVGILWIAQAVQLIVGIAYAYDTLKNNSSGVDKLISAIDSSLTDIKRSLDDVNKNLDRILDVLNDLPRIFQAAVDDSLVRLELGKCAGNMSTIQDNMKPGIFEQNLDTIDLMCNRIVESVYAIQGLTGPKGMLMTAPYYATWLATQAAVQKERLRQNKNHALRSPWNSVWTKSMKIMFNEVWELSQQQDIMNEEKIIPGMPPHMKNLAVNSSGSFYRTGDIPVDPRKKIYRLTCPGAISVSEKLQVKGMDPLNPGKIRWFDVDNNSEIEAIAAYTRVLVDRKELGSFYTVIPELIKKKKELMLAFEEPSEFW